MPPQVTDRKISILTFARRYGNISAALVAKYVTGRDGSLARSELRKLEALGFMRRRHSQVPTTASSVCPVWSITVKGAAALATLLDDMTLFLEAEIGGNPQAFGHHLQVSECLIQIDRAVAQQEAVQLGRIHFENECVSSESEPEKKYKLYTVVAEGPKRIVAIPDASVEFHLGCYKKAFYLEYETGSDGSAHRVARKKSPGYVGMYERKLWLRHYPQSKSMSVLAVCPSPNWRDELRKHMAAQPGRSLWRFLAVQDVSRFLQEPVIYTCTDGPHPFVRSAASPSEANQENKQ